MAQAEAGVTAIPEFGVRTVAVACQLFAVPPDYKTYRSYQSGPSKTIRHLFINGRECEVPTPLGTQRLSRIKVLNAIIRRLLPASVRISRPSPSRSRRFNMRPNGNNRLWNVLLSVINKLWEMENGSRVPGPLQPPRHKGHKRIRFVTGSGTPISK